MKGKKINYESNRGLLLREKITRMEDKILGSEVSREEAFRQARKLGIPNDLSAALVGAAFTKTGHPLHDVEAVEKEFIQIRQDYFDHTPLTQENKP